MATGGKGRGGNRRGGPTRKATGRAAGRGGNSSASAKGGQATQGAKSGQGPQGAKSGQGSKGSKGSTAKSHSQPVRRPNPQPGRSPLPPSPRSPAPTGPFRLGAVAGATPGKWIDTWHRRLQDVDLDLIPLTASDQRAALETGTVDAALVRLPIDRDGLHVITLYDEVPVVVCAADSHLTAADELAIGDLAGEVIITPADDVLGMTAATVPGTVAPVFDAPLTTEEAIETVATGVGVVIVPMSLARLHHRKDVDYRPLAEGPASTVALAWRAEATTPLVEAFIGIVRGRTANSSR